MVNATVHIGDHDYTSNWAVAETRYKTLLGMSCNKECHSKTDYDACKETVDGVSLPMGAKNTNTIKVTNLNAKTFRPILLRGCKEHTMLFQVRPDKIDEELKRTLQPHSKRVRFDRLKLNANVVKLVNKPKTVVQNPLESQNHWMCKT